MESEVTGKQQRRADMFGKFLGKQSSVQTQALMGSKATTVSQTAISVGESIAAGSVAPVAVEEPTRDELFPPAPEPTSTDVTPLNTDVDLLTQHARLSEKLGVHSDSIDKVRTIEFETFLNENGLRIYDRKQVDAYLTSMYGVEKKQSQEDFARRSGVRVMSSSGFVLLPTWGWRPARSKDVSRGDGLWLGAINGRNGGIQNYTHQYGKPIPIPVLITMERVAEKFPDAQMFVSDEIDAREFVKDPFLMVVYLGKHYIIERWDEPNYKER
jgi:hypothetical protein